MAPVTLPPGFRFHPTDEELIMYYLSRKINGQEMELDIIPTADLYKCEPWDLPGKSLLPSKDMEWYFFSSRDRKYPNGSRTNRSTMAGYWKATGKDRMVHSNKQSVVGMKKTLVYYTGRAPHGIRTDWMMHEYRAIDSSVSDAATSSFKDKYALCRIIKKSMCKPQTSSSDQNGNPNGRHWIPNGYVVGDDHMTGSNTEEEIREMKHMRANAKYPSESSLSEVTQEVLIDDREMPSSVDEANSSMEACNHINVDLKGPLEEKIFSPTYLHNQLHHPPLVAEDFPHMGIIKNQLHHPPLVAEDFPHMGMIEIRLSESQAIEDYITCNNVNEEYIAYDIFYSFP